MIPKPLLEPMLLVATKVLNRNLAQSTPGRALASRLEAKSMAISLNGPGIRVRATVQDGQLALINDEVVADAEVTGTPLALMALIRQESPVAGSAGVSVTGDPEIAQSFQKLFSACRPELEAELARTMGEAPAQWTLRALNQGLDFARRVSQTLQASVSEYLTEESRDLPAKTQAAQLSREVDRLRDDVERAGARLQLLEERRRRLKGEL